MIQNKDILVIIAAAIIIGFFWFYNSHKEKKQKKEMEKLKMDYLLRMMTAIDNFVKKYDEYKDKISAENLQPMKLNGFQKEYEYEEVYIQISGDKIYRTAAEPATKDSYSLIFLENLIITNYKLLLKSTNDRHEL
ncbi:MAG: hypothetical protein GTO45_04185, partial [Candidatus Aminicenantes bacterium]|nr:hypothetical protein [Candidatus Aminicenantes bacterium]NIM82269.1 hypothetical protein [Candidatus Aminicenantes bacterium]NIN17267.1 hypothetical protein [Candidatus Aminicenantes bacterium]NIN41136.1 hypothetical protein [Candidatus Aminicenantes bacterium]NIN83935.1 hypothetical protein [Candidatus Aminicenantes bacterium]